MMKWPGLDSQVSMVAVSACLMGGCLSKMPVNWLMLENIIVLLYIVIYGVSILCLHDFRPAVIVSVCVWKKPVGLYSMYIPCVHLTRVLTLYTLSVNLSVSVVLEWRHAQLSLMALCSTCRLTGQGSTAPEANSHKQKVCVYWHQATTSLSPAGGNTQKHRKTWQSGYSKVKLKCWVIWIVFRSICCLLIS